LFVKNNTKYVTSLKTYLVLETIYRHTTLVDEQLVNFEVMDTVKQVVGVK